MRMDIFDGLDLIEGEENKSFKAYFSFDDSLALFKGHFPNRPLLPGVMQIEMVRSSVEAFTMGEYAVVKIIKAKFSGEVLPDQEIEVSATMEPEGNLLKVVAKLKVHERVVATVSMLLRKTGESG